MSSAPSETRGFSSLEEIRATSWEAPAIVPAFGSRALIAGLIGAVVLAIGFFVRPEQFFQSYLVGYLYWLGIALGCLAVSMIQHLSAGGWGLAVRRVLGAAHRTLPIMALLFVPVLLGIGHLYIWADPAEVAHNEFLQHKEPYLNKTFFIVRAVIYFLVWIGLSQWLSRLSLKRDEEDQQRRLYRRVQRVSGFGLGIYVLTATFAAFDWLMSLAPEWYSTIYGIWFIGGHGLSAFAFISLVALWLSQHEPMSRVVRPRHFHDYGKLMLAFVMLWAYFSFSQFLIIWSGNLPEEITFYLDRFRGGWQVVAVALVVAHFALPFALLLSRDLKRNARRLGIVAFLVLVMRWVDIDWQVAPVFHQGLSIHWLDVAAMVGVGGIWLYFFTRQLASRPLLAVGDPQIEEALRDE